MLRLANPSGIDLCARRPPVESARGGRVCEKSRRNYGSSRIHDHVIYLQERLSQTRVVRLMQEEGLKARVRKQYKHTTSTNHDQPVAANLLARQFEAEAPNQRWVGDTTEFVIGDVPHKLYLAG
jgi:transposase InsO family protein